MKKLITLAAALSLALVCFAQTPTQYQPQVCLKISSTNNFLQIRISAATISSFCTAVWAIREKKGQC